MTVLEHGQLFLVSLSAIFFVVDPIGLVPLFIAMTADDPPHKVRSMALKACVVGCGLLVFFALFGDFLLSLLGLSLSAFRVAGGILLLITALDMLKARTSETRSSEPEREEGTRKEDVAIVPLAIPLLAGPGSIATVMVLMSKAQKPAAVAPVLVAIAVTFFATYLILRAALHVQKLLGQTGVAILQRVMGLLLAAFAVQFIAEGARALWQA